LNNYVLFTHYLTSEAQTVNMLSKSGQPLLMLDGIE